MGRNAHLADPSDDVDAKTWLVKACVLQLLNLSDFKSDTIAVYDRCRVTNRPRMSSWLMRAWAWMSMSEVERDTSAISSHH
ncbi:hypothetical protein ASF70_13030 [Rhizobium sp. Leaf321]|nr:hypothetical protein ASF70_13030 [Rhizobium sp. Leaf321]